MPKPGSTQITIPEWKYSCTNCGECCRRWFVAIASPEEKSRLKSMTWHEEDGIPEKIFVKIKGHDYLAHTQENYCIFLEPETNMCKIHGRFGIEAKPLGCRVYPYNITSTFPGKFSVIPRFDCPPVRIKHGKQISSSITSIREYIAEMGIKGGYDKDDLDHLTEPVIHKLIKGFFSFLFERKDLDIPITVRCALKAINRIECLGPDFLNQMDLGDILPSFFERIVEDMTKIRVRKTHRIERMMFLGIFASYFRRDEEMFGQGLQARLHRTRSLWQIVWGRGNLHDLGSDHPDFVMKKSRVFSAPIANSTEVDWSLALDVIKLRLQSFQFFGVSNYNLGFFTGFRSLLFFFPLVMAASKWSALGRNPEECKIEMNDIDYAVSVIDHSLGRSALLNSGMFTMLVRQLTDFDRYSALQKSLMGTPQ